MPQWPDPPKMLVMLAGSIVVIGAFVMVAGASAIGVTVDEVYHVDRLQNFFRTGWYLLDGDLVAEEPGSWVTDAYVYSPVATLYLHALNVLSGHESWGAVSATADAYRVRHLGISLLGLLGVASTAAMVRVVSGSWRWGLLGAAVLLSLPMWVGHSMMNVKDIPVAVGYTFVTLGCMMAIADGRTDRKGQFAALLLVFLGVLIAVGTRPAIWPGLAAALAWAALSMLGGADGVSRTVAHVGPPLLGAMLALLSLVWIYPSVFIDIGRWPLASAGESTGYAGNTSWVYIPATVFMTVPILLLVLILLGVIATVVRRFRGPGSLSAGEYVLMLPVLQALLLPTLLVVHPAAMHEGLRHVLFAAPGVSVLAVVAVRQLLRDAHTGRSRALASGVVAIALASPVISQVQSFPYGYNSSNLLAVVAGTPLSSDPWQASFHEYADVVGATDFVICGADVDQGGAPVPTATVGGPWLSLGQNCATYSSTLSPYTGSRGSAAQLAGSFVALVNRLDEVSNDCQELATVDRRRLFDRYVVSRALRCPLRLPPYSGPERLTSGGRGHEYLFGEWSGLDGDPFVTARVAAHVGFRLEVPLRSAQVRVEGSETGATVFEVNNRRVAVRREKGEWIVPIPPDREPLGDPTNVLLTVVPVDGVSRVSGFELQSRAKSSNGGDAG